MILNKKRMKQKASKKERRASVAKNAKVPSILQVSKSAKIP
jgi:hypothetical protein